MISIYTDGGAKGNPGPGAYGVILNTGYYSKTLAQAFRKTTNNRMELWAVIVGLEALRKENQQVLVYSDSRYVVEPITKGWLRTWFKTDFKGKKNPDLWKRFFQVYSKHDVTLHWVKGHAGHVHNEHCHQLVTACMQKGPWYVDEVYEKEYPDPYVVKKQLVG